MSKTVITPKGTSLPLTNLKGKDYLMVAFRLQWMVEEVPNFDISTEFLLMTDEQTVARASVVIADKDGRVLKRATATKRETKKDFPDHLEKAETSAIGRALAMLGFGTQFAIADLDEGNRLADSPLVNTKAEAPTVVATLAETPAKKKSFRKSNTLSSLTGDLKAAESEAATTTQAVTVNTNTAGAVVVSTANGWE